MELSSQEHKLGINFVAQGYSYKYATYYYNGTKRQRDLVKVYGVLIDISTSTQAQVGDETPYQLFNYFASVIVYAGAPGTVCQLIVIVCSWCNSNYRKARYVGDSGYVPMD